MNYFSVIRPPSGQITQPQSCAFLHGVDWKLSTLDRRSLSATHGWSIPNGTALTPWTPLGLHKAGQFYYPLRSSCVAPGTSLCGLPYRGKEGKRMSKYVGIATRQEVRVYYPTAINVLQAANSFSVILSLVTCPRRVHQA
ncbi:hypothetical protein AVEN_184768-1 [Araneus ventricosus]|uniref:Uncharacterized protein n=1 Tax=Araneus ventricosus TaxID=182803 RepID=A0A4Y2SPS1_ARAVE|nr:hypothetical protein AVEN_172249-1 [Araneus ventricosus]GBN89882.1 hypothetical protein AVEN_184768-1 [Araneus ventricosus]